MGHGTDGRVDALTRIVHETYEPAEFPALAAQAAAWQRERPLGGARVVDATPVFRNTLAKHLALLSGGADLVVAALPTLPSDPRVLDLLRAAGIPVVADARDLHALHHVGVACDCAGVLARLEPRYGAVELTRTGVAAYADLERPVIVVDDSRLKLIETSLGTGEGFVRAMRQIGHGEFAGRTVLVFGAGKVGRGVAAASRAAGASVTLVDSQEPPPAGAGSGAIDRAWDSAVIHAADKQAVVAAIAQAWCVVTATGVSGALAQYARQLSESAALLANMGVDDEFGPAVPSERVLSRKAPLNFVLTEPTRLRYLDPVFALANVATVHLLRGDGPTDVEPPPREWEDEILADVLAQGALADELVNALPQLL